MRTILAVFFFVAALPAMAQQSLFILVEGQGANPIPGADITVFEAATGAEFASANSDGDGRAVIDGVNPSQEFTARVTAVNYVPFNGPLDFPASGRREDDPVVITLARIALPAPPDRPPPPGPARENQTITLTEAFFNDTLAAGWQHSAPGSDWLQRCQLFQTGTAAMPDGWVMRASQRLWNVWSAANCNFRLFAGRDLNDPWTLVDFTIVDGGSFDRCFDGATINVTSAVAGVAGTIPLTVHIIAPDKECSAAVSEVTVNGPAGEDPKSAFLP